MPNRPAPSPSQAKSSTAPTRPFGEAAQSSLPASCAPARRGRLPSSAAPPDRTVEQHREALKRANDIRFARAELKRRIATGEIFPARVLLEMPREARSWRVGEFLKVQRRWGDQKVRRFLACRFISEVKPLEKLTERQRRELARALGQGIEGEGRGAEASGVRPGGSSGDLAALDGSGGEGS